MTANHIVGYINSEKFEIVALSDLSERAMDDFDDQFSAQGDYQAAHFSDAHEMLAESSLDVVSVGVWDIGHAPMTIAAAASAPPAAIALE